MASTNEINLSSSPHSFSKLGTGNTMLMVIIALLPLCVKGVFLYGKDGDLVYAVKGFHYEGVIPKAGNASDGR